MKNINVVYIIFPLILLLLNTIKNNKIKFVLSYCLFVFVFVMAKNGSDYEGYKYLYNNYSTTTGLHGEPLYVAINILFYSLGLSYEMFRVIFLSAFLFLFLFSLYKISNNFIISFVISYVLFLVYFVSAYRQFATIAIFIFSIYLLFYNKSIYREKITIIINFLAIFIHSLAIFQLFLFVIIILYRKIKKRHLVLNKEFLKQNLLIIILTMVITRIVVYFVCSQEVVQNFFAWIPYFNNLSLLDLGCVSRGVIFTVIVYLYFDSSLSSRESSIFAIYFVSMIIYVAFPFELIMGRLINNIRFLECILIPLFIIKNKNFNNKYSDNYYQNLCIKNTTIYVIFGVCIVVLLSQLVLQSGYDNYEHFISILLK